MQLDTLRDQFHRLVLYHRISESTPSRAMQSLLQSAGPQRELHYLALTRAVFAQGAGFGLCRDGWQNHLLTALLGDVNPFTVGAAAGKLNPELAEAAVHDLRILQQLFQLTGPVCRELAASPHLPTWPGWDPPAVVNPTAALARALAAQLSQCPDWASFTPTLAEYHRRAGAGLMGGYWFLQWRQGELVGIEEPHLFNLADLVGLQEAKETVIRNTEQFLHGHPANNLLLYGSRGTGKSSTVRGLGTRYGETGLRIVEMTAQEIGSLPDLFRHLKQAPQRFIIFLDDLSFDDGDQDYKLFKSLVEGAAEQRPHNVLLYATSNRRHLLPQRWTDRAALAETEVHSQDAVEEKLSLADRFGVTVLFTRPDQEEYLHMIEEMVRLRGLSVDQRELRAEALRWEMWHNSRSGRTARQFVDDLVGRLALRDEA